MNDEASYICEYCGEEIVVPVDVSAGANQEYVEDCPVCCNSNIVRVDIDAEGNAHTSGEAEQDQN